MSWSRSIGRSRGTGSPGRGWRWPAGTSLARSRGIPLHAMLGGTRSEVLSGVSLGIETTIEIPVRPDRPLPRGRLSPHQAEDRAGVGRRGRPAGPRAVSATLLQVDANSAYTLDDLPTLRALDDFDLLLIEQPLAHDDIIDHARLQAEISDAGLPGREHPLGRRRPQGARAGRLPGDQYQGEPAGRPARGQAGARRLPGAGRARLVRRDARVRHRPGGERGDREPARIHAARRRLRLGQVLRRGHRRAADPGASAGPSRCSKDRDWESSRSMDRIEARTLRTLTIRGMGGSMMDVAGSSEARRRRLGERACSSHSRELVQLESPSRDKPALDALAHAAGESIAPSRTARSRSSPTPRAATTCSARFPGPSRSPAGAWCWATTTPSGRRARSRRMPFRVEGGRAFGPGDLRHEGRLDDRFVRPAKHIELQGPLSTPGLGAVHLRRGDRQPDLAGPDRGPGAGSAPTSWYSSRRWPTAASRPRGRGSAGSASRSKGKAAHAGVAPEEGRSAIVELAHQVVRIQELQDLAAGTTINVGVDPGGHDHQRRAGAGVGRNRRAGGHAAPKPNASTQALRR